jgi:hypothetical protein
VRSGVVLLEIQDVLDVGAAPGIDGLVVVAHHHDAPVGGEPLHDLVLDAVGVLVLVDEHVSEALAPGLFPLRKTAEEVQHVQEQVVEVHGVGGLQGLAVVLEDLGRVLGDGIEGGGEVLGTLVLVLAGADDAAEHVRRGGLDGKERAGLGDHLPLVVVVVDGEGVPVAQVSGVRAQDAGADAVEGAHPMGCRLPHQLFGAFAHLAGGLVGEGQRHDLAGSASEPPDQPGDLPGEHAGLARPGPRQDQLGSVVHEDGFRLRRIEFGADPLFQGHFFSLRCRLGTPRSPVRSW